jgi:RNA polymerase sigma factor (sigma-70 family)
MERKRSHRLTDAKLLAEYRRTGSREAYSEIVSRHANAVYATCLRTLSDAHSAEDAAQAAFLVFLKKGRKLSRKTVLAGWLHRTARNCAWNLKGAAARRTKHEREAMAVNAKSAETPAEVERARPELDAALDSLPTAQREALALRYLRGLPRAEVAAELGCPERTVESRLRLGLEKLRAKLSKRGVTLSAAALVGILGEEISAPAALTASIQRFSLGTATASAAATATAEAIMKMMMWTKVKLLAGFTAAAVVLTTGLAITAAMGLGCVPGLGEQGKSGVAAADVTAARSGADPAAARIFGQSVKGLAVSLKLDPPNWETGNIKKVAVEMTLRNVTRKKMLVYKSWAEDPTPNCLAITDARGGHWRISWRLKQSMVTDISPAYFTSLKPGEEKVFRYVLEGSSFLPPDGYFSGLKKDVGVPSRDERVTELPPGEYTFRFGFAANLHEFEAFWNVPGTNRAQQASDCAKRMGYNGFWTGSARSEIVKVRVVSSRSPGKPKTGNVF